MQFELTPEIIDQIIFAMENQETPFMFDSQTRTVVDDFPKPPSVSEGGDEEQASGRYAEIPEWSSADGFQLMERFVATLRNPLAREKLRAALAGGKGVFRNFKNTLKEHGEIERLWFSFKDREMRAKVLDWYNDLCDLWGWERVSPEPEDEEETDQLVLSDFAVNEDPRGVDLVRAYDREAWEEALSGLPVPIVASLYRRARVGIDPAAANSIIVSARTPGGEFAGFVWGVVESDEETEGDSDGTWLTIAQLYVTRDFRGLGIAKTLIAHICRVAYARGIQRIMIELGGTGEVLLRSLEDEGYSVVSRTLMLDVEEWGTDSLDR